MSEPKFETKVLEDGTKVVTLIKEPKQKQEQKSGGDKPKSDNATK